MKLKIFNTEIYVSFLFAAVIAFMLVTDRTGLIIPTIFAVLIHEVAHLFTMWVMECAPKSIRLIPASVQIVRSFSPKPYGETAIALMGPICNLIAFFVLWLNYFAYGNETVLRFALINLIIGVFNLLPIKGLDGGTVLYGILCRRFEEYRAERILRTVTIVLSLVSLIVAILLTVNGGFNPSAYILAIYLAISALIKK